MTFKSSNYILLKTLTFTCMDILRCAWFLSWREHFRNFANPKIWVFAENSVNASKPCKMITEYRHLKLFTNFWKIFSLISDNPFKNYYEDVLGVQPILKYVYAKNSVTESAICNQPLGIKFICEFILRTKDLQMPKSKRFLSCTKHWKESILEVCCIRCSLWWVF
jgi:hypothetical protein